MRLFASESRGGDDDCVQCASGRHGQCNDPSCTCCYGAGDDSGER
jgi:hypothetical protein